MLTIEKIGFLYYQRKALGLRITFNKNGIQHKVDCLKDALRRHGVYNMYVGEPIVLKESKGYVLSDEEIESGKFVDDITDSVEQVQEVVHALSFSKYKEKLALFDNIIDYTLQDFVQDRGFVALPVNRADEHKNQHNLQLPNETMYRGGWIGQAKSPQLAKQLFHKNLLKYRIHWGVIPRSYVLKDYPDFQEAVSIIKGYEEKFYTEDNNGKVLIGYKGFQDKVDRLVTRRNRLSSRQMLHTLDWVEGAKFSDPSYISNYWSKYELFCIAYERFLGSIGVGERGINS